MCFLRLRSKKLKRDVYMRIYAFPGYKLVHEHYLGKMKTRYAMRFDVHGVSTIKDMRDLMLKYGYSKFKANLACTELVFKGVPGNDIRVELYAAPLGNEVCYDSTERGICHE